MINLRTYSKYNIKYSIVGLGAIIDKALADGDTHVALLDKELHSTIYLAKMCAKAGLQPMIGFEYNSSITLWATDHDSLRRLNVISTMTSRDKAWAWSKDLFEGIVAVYHPTDMTVAELKINQLTDYCSKVYLEVKEFDENKQEIIELSDDLDVAIIPTSDVFYAERKHALSHDYYHNYIHKDGEHLPSDQFFIKSKSDFEGWAHQQWIKNVESLASTVKLNVVLGTLRLPEFDSAPEGKTNFEYLTDMCTSELVLRLEKIPHSEHQTYQDRLNYELGDIENASLESYFLIVKDICDFAKTNKIKKGRGRGSSAGSLVCYLTGITGIDPIEYGTIWERFYNAGREGALPDIDTDFEKERRSEIIDYIGKRWGEDSVFQIITFGGFGPAKAIKAVLSLGQCSFEEQTKVSKLVHHKSKNIQDAIERSPELADEAKRRRAMFEIAKHLEGNYESFGKHAAGVIISNEPYMNGGLPMTWHEDDQRFISGYDLNAVEDYGLLKVDILGLNTLNIIKRAEQLIRQRHDKNFSTDEIPLDDVDVYTNIFDKGQTKCIFQLESQLGQKYSSLVKPRSILEIADLITIIRPGAMEPGMDKQYLNVRDGKEVATYPHPKLEKVLGETYSACIYQEQVMFICTEIAGLDLKAADNVRRAAGKKKKELMDQQMPIFVQGCKAHGVSTEVANTLWSWIVEFSGYGFNKSHAVCYAFLSYESAYLKHHYPLEFFEASCNYALGDLRRSHHDKLREVIYDAKAFDITVRLPNIVACNTDFEIVDDKSIRFGLSWIKGVGDASISTIEQCKDATTYTEFIITALKNGLRKNIIEALICSGAMDHFGLTRNTMLADYQLLDSLTDREYNSLIKEIKSGDKISALIKELADDDKVVARKAAKLIVPNVKRRAKIRDILGKYKAKDKYESIIHIATYERTYLGCDISVNETDGVFSSITHTLAEVKKIPRGTKQKVQTALHIDSIRTTLTKKGKNPGQEMAFITGSDGSAILDSLVLFPQQYKKFKNLLQEGRVVFVDGYTSETGGLIVNNIGILR